MNACSGLFSIWWLFGMLLVGMTCGGLVLLVWAALDFCRDGDDEFVASLRPGDFHCIGTHSIDMYPGIRSGDHD